jgi:hypothetical protein
MIIERADVIERAERALPYALTSESIVEVVPA